MSLRLGSKLNRSYSYRLPFNNGFYNVTVFLDKGSTFSLFSIDTDFEGLSGRQGSAFGGSQIFAARAHPKFLLNGQHFGHK